MVNIVLGSCVRRHIKPSWNRRFSDYLTAAMFLLGVAFVAAYFGGLRTEMLVGRASVIDGDSLVLNGEQIRLEGIDAPELGQVCAIDGRSIDCGGSARRELQLLIGTAQTRCEGWQYDKYARLLARCTAGPKELNRLMVRNGWAVSFGDFESEELAARNGGRGIWQGSFVRPREWRAERATRGETTENPHAVSPMAFVASAISRIIGFVTNWGE